MSITYDFLRHMTSGEVFAVAFGEGQQVIASLGPIEEQELTFDPSDFAPNMTTEDNDWFNDGDEFRLVDATEIANIRDRAEELANA